KAALLAATETPIEASIAVIVVPILSPNRTGKAAFNVMADSAYKPCKIPMVALELCTTNVNIVPITNPKIGLSLILKVNSWKKSNELIGAIPFPINFNPKNNEPKPKIACPTTLTFWCLKKNNIKLPKAMIGKAYSPILKSIINAVTVVPIFAPIITPIACLNVIKPALTKATVNTVVPELLWIKIVTDIPASTPKNGLFVNLSKISRNRSPAAFCKPSPIYLIPSRKIPKLPMYSNIIVCMLFDSVSFLSATCLFNYNVTLLIKVYYFYRLFYINNVIITFVSYYYSGVISLTNIF